MINFIFNLSYYVILFTVQLFARNGEIINTKTTQLNI